MERKKIPYGFYSLVLMLNILVAVMFRVVTTPPPVQAASPDIHLARLSRTKQAIKGVPTRIVIASLNVDLPVATGTFDPSSNEWTVSDDKAFFADNSVPVNDSNGVTLIYGHARWGVFGVLPDLKNGAVADVYTDNGLVFHYQYQSVTQVTPEDMSVFSINGPPTLTLQTCTGAWDRYRAMYSFAYTGESSV